MKKFLIILLTICLCACGRVDDNQSTESNENISDGNQELFNNEKEEKNSEITSGKDYIEDNYDEYLKYYGLFSVDKVIKLVNLGLLNDSNKNKLVELYNSDYFVERLEDLYLQYFNDYEDVRDLLEIVNTNRYEALYSDIKTTDLDKGYLMLINKYHQLPSDYEPNDLVNIDEHYGRGQTRNDVYDAFVRMADDAYLDGYVLAVTSAYRSYDYQDGLYNKYLGIEGGNVAAVDSYSARPGHSEHQSGLCLDLVTPGYSMDDFGISDASKWVNENCYKYGFIIRYTAEKENITGYEPEAWQVRYVGDKDIAKYIRDTGISFDEYYTCFVE